MKTEKTKLRFLFQQILWTAIVTAVCSLPTLAVALARTRIPDSDHFNGVCMTQWGMTVQVILIVVWFISIFAIWMQE